MDPNWIPPDEQIWIINNKVTRPDTFICLGDVVSPEYAAQIKAEPLTFHFIMERQRFYII